MLNLLDHEVRAMLAAIDVYHPMGPRDYFLLVFLCHTGLRVSELTALNVSDVWHDGEPRRELWVRAETAKGKKSRIVPLNVLAQKAVSKMIQFNRRRGLSVDNTAPLFQTKRHLRLTPRTIQWFVANLREKAGLDVKAVPHTFRHAFGSHLLANGADLESVRQLLGHEYLASTQIYTHLAPGALEEHLRRMHPRFQSGPAPS
jgi:integrase/recombinase XerC